MARTTRQQRGIDFEQYVADALDGKLQPGSGSQWAARSDCVAHGLLLSAKAEADRTWGSTRRQLTEAIDYAQGTSLIPALATLDDDGEAIVHMRLADLARAFAGGVTPIVAQEKRSDRKRRDAAVPALLRTVDE